MNIKSLIRALRRLLIAIEKIDVPWCFSLHWCSTGFRNTDLD